MNKLSLNKEKTRFTIFHLPQRYVKPPNIFMENITIEFISKVHLLGI